MKLTRLRIRDFRSIFTDDTGADFSLDLGDGTNVLVGRNNCGKSNVLRAVALALDPHAPFDPAVDVPGPKQFGYPVITLTFNAGGGSAEEAVLLDAARTYEQRLTPGGSTFADEGKVVLEVQFPPVEQRGQRRFETLLTPSRARPVSPDQRDLLDTALAALRQTVRFVLISSGESIQSVLDGNFREILHSVIREHLTDHFEHAEQARQEYIHGLQDQLLARLRDRLASIVVGLFPEIDGVTLSPEVSGIEATLSHVAVNLRDAVDTPLLLKGTGVRRGVLVAMLRYLADNSTRGMVFALEEPEAFLHPAAQDDLRDNLEELAERDDVTLLVTTHSPFVISRSPHGRVFSLGKDTHGRTRVSAWARVAEHESKVTRETLGLMNLVAYPWPSPAHLLWLAGTTVCCLRGDTQQRRRPELRGTWDLVP